MTDVFEGSLIRVFRRLQELIRQMALGEFRSIQHSLLRTDQLLFLAARAIGSDELEQKFNDSLKCLERPNSVAFAASLVSTCV